MNKKRIAGLLITSMLIGGLTLTGCENNTNNNNGNDNNVVIEEVEEEEEDKGIRSNPYLIGETATVEFSNFLDGDGVLEITINEITRGDEANAIIAEENMFNDEPEEGHEFMLVDVTMKLVDKDEDDGFYINSTTFDFIDGTGATYDMSWNVIPNSLGGDLYIGGETSGNIDCEIRIDDEAPMLKYNDSWFALYE